MSSSVLVVLMVVSCVLLEQHGSAVVSAQYIVYGGPARGRFGHNYRSVSQSVSVGVEANNESQ